MGRKVTSISRQLLSFLLSSMLGRDSDLVLRASYRVAMDIGLSNTADYASVW